MLKIILNKIAKLAKDRIKFKKNVLNTHFKRRALICYTTLPFRTKVGYGHSNNYEALIIAKIICALEYNVDVVDYNAEIELEYADYELIFGFGDIFENSFFAPCSALRIYYGTGSHAVYQNQAEIRRTLENQARYGFYISPKRLVRQSWSCSTNLSDALIILGNKNTAATYEHYHSGKLYSINATAISIYTPQNLNRTFKESRTRFLWFGSAGLVHKGLDLCLKAFLDARLSNFELHICGKMEDDFFAQFKSELSEQTNIKFHGFVDISSSKFKDIVGNCAFSLFPCCSEGQSTSLLTIMATGNVPIYSKDCGVNFVDPVLELERLDADYIVNKILSTITWSEETIEVLSSQVSKLALDRHNIKVFEQNMGSILSELVREKDKSKNIGVAG